MLLYLLLFLNVASATLYHETSVLTFRPTPTPVIGEYFGFSVIIRNTTSKELVVGAPKAKYSTGIVYLCEIAIEKSDVECVPYPSKKKTEGVTLKQNDMWFGAAMASYKNDLIIGAPRWFQPYRDTHYLQQGLCYVVGEDYVKVLKPLSDMQQQAILLHNPRKAYSEYVSGTHLNYYAYGQAGISIDMIEDQVIIGAPGIMQWTGSIVHYKKRQRYAYYRQLETPNPYYTEQLGPDNYFGFSVALGYFLTKEVAYIASAPRSNRGLGSVLIFNQPESSVAPLKIIAEIIGEQLASYFGASLCVVDFNNDGKSDLLVGAPNFINDDELPFDQGAVYIYLSRVNDTKLIMHPAGYVMGSRKNGARFGTSIAKLGDVDGDGYPEVAIGAPFEDDGRGAVYIYKGCAEGLKSAYIQRIVQEKSSGFGYSISKGVDIDNNACNDLAIGAFQSRQVFLYRCIHTLYLDTWINVPDAFDLPQNSTNFKALFCIRSKPAPSWANVILPLKAKITVDRDAARAVLSIDPEYEVHIGPGQVSCEEKDIRVSPRADLSKPIQILFSVKPQHDPSKDRSKTFSPDWVRLSVESKLDSSFDIQLTRDCGEDLICHPLLEMLLSGLSTTPFIPGSGEKLGVNITVINTAEPAYGFKVNVTLPATPKRIPGECALVGENMTCEVPSPLHRNEFITWLIELDYVHSSIDPTVLKFEVDLWEPLGFKKKDDVDRNFILLVEPKADIAVEGKTSGNNTLQVTRKALDEEEQISFKHFIEITNYGPSNWPSLFVDINVPKLAYLSQNIDGCVENSTEWLSCTWSISANASKPISLPLKLNLKDAGNFLKENISIDLSTFVFVKHGDIAINITTSFILDPAPPFWPIIVGVVIGLIMFSGIFYLLYKYGFFSRTKREELKRLKLGETVEPRGSTASETENDGSSLELLSEDSD